jgi:hypothetical protein
MELRCGAKMHGLLEESYVEVRCRSTFCGAGKGVVVLHRFSTVNGVLLETKRYKDPAEGREVNGTRSIRTAVRRS